MTGTGGSATAPIADNAACVVISWLSAVYWRGGKPRTYLPGVIGTATTDGVGITTSFATGIKTAAQAFRTAVNALTQGAITGTALGFVSFRTGNADRVPPTFYAISDATVHHRLSTQRRRLGQWVA
jgi:hypothetical protein